MEYRLSHWAKYCIGCILAGVFLSLCSAGGAVEASAEESLVDAGESGFLEQEAKKKLDAADPMAIWYQHDRGKKIHDEGKPLAFGWKVVLYPVNRFKDLLDIFTVQLGFGFGLHAKGHATKALQAGGGAAAITRLGIDQGDIGLANTAVAEIGFLPVNIQYYKRQNAFGTYSEYNSLHDLPWRYQRYQDYFSVGYEATAFILGFRLEGHLTEVADFLTGIIGFDGIHNDDFPKRWTGNKITHLKDLQRADVKRVVVVPSRVISEATTRMEREKGIGVYYRRMPNEFVIGSLGSLSGAKFDERVSNELTGYLEAKDFSIYRELMERVCQTCIVHKQWDVVNDMEETLPFLRSKPLPSPTKGKRCGGSRTIKVWQNTMVRTQSWTCASGNGVFSAAVRWET